MSWRGGRGGGVGICSQIFSFNKEPDYGTYKIFGIFPDKRYM